MINMYLFKTSNYVSPELNSIIVKNPLQLLLEWIGTERNTAIVEKETKRRSDTLVPKPVRYQ